MCDFRPRDIGAATGLGSLCCYCWHATSRHGIALNRRRGTSLGDDDYSAYLELMRQWCGEHGVDVCAYWADAQPRPLAGSERIDDFEPIQPIVRIEIFRVQSRDACLSAGAEQKRIPMGDAATPAE